MMKRADDRHQQRGSFFLLTVPARALSAAVGLNKKRLNDYCVMANNLFLFPVDLYETDLGGCFYDDEITMARNDYYREK